MHSVVLSLLKFKAKAKGLSRHQTLITEAQDV